MSGNIFVDTNVLVYARDTTEPQKHRRARAWVSALWEHRTGRLSFQVLQEYYVTVTHKLDPGMSASEARADVRSLLAWNPVPADQPLMESAWRMEERFKLSWWDSLIVAAAQATGARYLLTEDLQADMDFEGVRVVNPFRSTFADLPV